MAYVPVPKDLTKVKSKLLFNLRHYRIMQNSRRSDIIQI